MRRVRAPALGRLTEDVLACCWAFNGVLRTCRMARAGKDQAREAGSRHFSGPWGHANWALVSRTRFLAPVIGSKHGACFDSGLGILRRTRRAAARFAREARQQSWGKRLLPHNVPLCLYQKRPSNLEPSPRALPHTQ